MTALAMAWLAAWHEAWGNRRSFWTQVGLMAANNLIWIVFWALFFDRVGAVRGWDLDQLVVLLAVLMTAAGIVAGLFSNLIRLGQLIGGGELDAALSLPVPTLPYLACRRVEPMHVGDLLFGVVLFGVLGGPTPARAAAYVVGVVCATLIMAGFLVLVGSLAFRTGRSEAGEFGFQALILFSMYPIDLFPGPAKVLLYVVIPAGFVSSAPARMVEGFDPVWALGTAAVGAGLLAAGWSAFAAGLRRYTSGALWTQG